MANMSFSAIHENKILAKISQFTVIDGTLRSNSMIMLLGSDR